TGFRVRDTFAVDGPLDKPVGTVVRAYMLRGRALQRVILGAHHLLPAVPPNDGLAGDVTEHPALTRLHAGLVYAHTEHGVVVTHGLASAGVGDRALASQHVELGAGGEGAGWAVVG